MLRVWAGAECHYTAWSGFGMAENCCGGATLASDVWLRTLATVGSANASDPHGTTRENAWDFGKWTAEAVVINLGTNDHLSTRPRSLSDAYKARYEALIVAASEPTKNAIVQSRSQDQNLLQGSRILIAALVF